MFKQCYIHKSKTLYENNKHYGEFFTQKGFQLMDSTINQRIKVLVNELAEGVQKDFAHKTGIPDSTLSAMLGKRQAEPGYGILIKILSTYENVNEAWLIRGIGEKYKSGNTVVGTSSNTSQTGDNFSSNSNQTTQSKNQYRKDDDNEGDDAKILKEQNEGFKKEISYLKKIIELLESQLGGTKMTTSLN